MAEIDEYKEWLASAPTTDGIIDTIEVSHPSWAGTVYLANWDVDITCRVEDIQTPQDILFKAARFWLEPSETGDTTEQATSVAISSLDGLIYDELRNMTPDERAQAPIKLVPRQYWISDQSKQLINPAPTWEIHNVAVSLDVVRGELQAAPMRVHRTGRYYTALEFPVLEFTR